MNHERLGKLRQDTNLAIQNSVTRRSLHMHEAINWADLQCVEAAWVVTDNGSEYALVTIEEASPEASDFRMFILSELRKAGWTKEIISVVTEW